MQEIRFVTVEQAVDMLYELVDSGILDDNIVNKILDLAYCLKRLDKTGEYLFGDLKERKNK